MKNNLCKFFIFLFVVLILISFSIFADTKNEYYLAKNDVTIAEAEKTIQSIYGNFSADVDTSRLDKVILKRNICIGTIVVSIIGIIICCIILFSKSKETMYEKTVDANNSIQSKLQELEQIYKNNLITEEEYNSKRRELLSKM